MKSCWFSFVLSRVVSGSIARSVVARGMGKREKGREGEWGRECSPPQVIPMAAAT